MSRPYISYSTPAGPSNYQDSVPPAAPHAHGQMQMDTAHLPRRSSLQVREGVLQSRAVPNTLDSSITRLLVFTKQLLQGLEQWALGSLSEDNVSDVYVRLGDGFETCVAAFHRVGIQTRELDHIPLDLRHCLEQCLAEEPCQESLNLYLPDIRQIIYDLLDGLRKKQAQYKRIIKNAEQQSTPPPPPAHPAIQASTSAQYVPGMRSVSPQPAHSAQMSGQGQIHTGARTTHNQNSVLPPPPPIGIPDDRLSVRSAASNASGTSGGSRGDAGGVGDRERDKERGGSPAPRSTGSSSEATVPMPPKIPSSTALAERERERQQRQPSGQSRPAPPDAFRPPRRIASDTTSQPVSRGSPAPSPIPPSAPTIGETTSMRGFQLKDDGPVPSRSTPPSDPPPAPAPPGPGPSNNLSISTSSSTSNKPTPPRPDRFSRDRDSYAAGRVSRFSADSDITNGSPVKSPTARSPPTHIQTLAEMDDEHEPALPTGTSTTFSAMADAPALPKLELPSTSISFHDEDKDMTSSSSDGVAVNGIPDIPPESQRTLAALRSFDHLERRASKRYSSFTFNKMLPSSPNNKREKVPGGPSPQRPAQRRADSQLERVPPMPSLPEVMLRPEDAVPSSSRMARSIEESGEGRAGSPGARSDGSNSSMKIMRTPEARPIDEADGSSLMEQTPRGSHPDRAGSHTSARDQDSERATSAIPPAPPDTPAPTSFQVYLQLGRQVKKCRLDLPVTFEGLRLLFMEKFEYDPGLDDFPDVYLRDPISGVGYELEDIGDVLQGAVLSLNIEPLDQVKQHFDHTFASLMAEVKEMKSALAQTRRMSISTATSLLAVSQSQVNASLRNNPPSAATSPNVKPSSRLPSPRLEAGLGGAAFPLSSIRREELEKQQDEVLSLRRDLAIIRQIHSDFLSETKESFGKLRTQNNAMKDVIKTKIGGSRALLDNSKAKLESQCSETIQAVEEIQDVIDAAREDAYKRFVTPSNIHMKKIRTDLAKAIGLADGFASDVGASETTWRATWAQELSRVKEEQNLLAHQRKLGEDLKNDLKDAAEMWTNVEAFVMQRKEQAAVGGGGAGGVGGSGIGAGGRTPTGVRSFGFRPPSPDADGNGEGGIPNLLMEIRTKEADPTSRLRAIEAQQRQREREKQEKKEEKDEFAGELEGFVKGRKLRKTGGTEEVERARSRRQELTLKKMLTGETVPTPSTGGAGGGGRLSSPIAAGGASPISGAGSRQGTMSPQVTGTSLMRVTPQMTGSSTKSGSGSVASVSGSGGEGSKRVSREG